MYIYTTKFTTKTSLYERRRERFLPSLYRCGFTMYERMQCKIVMHEMNELGIDDLFVGMEVVPKVKLGYCSPFQLEKNN